MDGNLACIIHATVTFRPDSVKAECYLTNQPLMAFKLFVINNIPIITINIPPAILILFICLFSFLNLARKKPANSEININGSASPAE